MVEPLPLEVASAAQTSRSIGIKVQVMGIGCISVDKEGAAIPVWKEGLPPVDVCPGLRVQANVVMELLGCGTEVDETAQEQATRWDHPCRKAQRPY